MEINFKVKKLQVTLKGEKEYIKSENLKNAK